jgi:hypothetical protein
MKITQLVFTSLFIISSPYSIADNCGFVKQIDSLVKLSPKKALKTNRFGDPAPFLSIGDGIGPSSPGIGEKDEAECVSRNYKFHMIWAGGDVSACDRQSEVVEKAQRYAKKYNNLLRKNLTSDNKYLCTADLLVKEKEKRCAETGHPLCTGLEDWKEAFFALNQFVWKLNSTSVVSYDPEKYGQFSASIRDVQHRKEIEEKACELFPKYGIKMDVTIHIELANFNPEIQQWKREKLDNVVCTF